MPIQENNMFMGMFTRKQDDGGEKRGVIVGSNYPGVSHFPSNFLSETLFPFVLDYLFFFKKIFIGV